MVHDHDGIHDEGSHHQSHYGYRMFDHAQEALTGNSIVLAKLRSAFNVGLEV